MTLKGEAKRKYQREWLANRRAEFFKDKQCLCGSTDRLELDHIDPSKKITHNIWSWSTPRREAELAKCQVLCYTCHKAKSAKDAYQRFCPKGHDTEVTGRKPASGNGCRACAQEYDRRYRMESTGKVPNSP